MQPPPIATVVVDQAVGKGLDYAIPEDLRGKVRPGVRVAVPLRQGMAKGTVFALKEKSDVPRLAELSALLHEQPHFTPDLLELAHWMARYYCTPLDKVVKMLLPSPVRKDVRAREQLWVKASGSSAQLIAYCTQARERAPAHAQLLDVLLRFPKGMFLSELKERARVSDSVVQALLKQGVIRTKRVHGDYSLLSSCDVFPSKPKQLNEEQSQALKDITCDLAAQEFRVRLVHGITGSGKTEVYLQAIAHALSLGKQVLLLIPEIALAEQTLSMVRGRFREKVVLLHHRLAQGERNENWEKMCAGEVSLVVGARSAIFSPLPHLGLIIVDEEHEGAYKHEEAPAYHARDIAVMRGKIARAAVILGSATPSLESYHNALAGKYALSTLTARVERALLPSVRIVNMRKEREKKNFSIFSETLIDALKERYTRGEQALLFLNRRGYHTLLVCASCGESLHCPHCDVALTFYRGVNRISCHLCDYALSPPPAACPDCKGQTLKFKGVGTEFVERALHAILPDIRTLRIDADTTAHKGSHELLFKQFKSGKADVLVGTQMIAKGLHFPSVTFVGILNADSTLHIPDFRSGETLFQLLTQVSGRAGRGDLPGEVLVQTHMPEHPVIRQAITQDYTGFFHAECANRKAFQYPPFAKLAKVTFSGRDERETKCCGETVRCALIAALPAEVSIYPLAPAGYARVKDQFRFQLLVKAERLASYTATIASCARAHSRAVRVLIDIDPLNTFF